MFTEGFFSKGYLLMSFGFNRGNYRNNNFTLSHKKGRHTFSVFLNCFNMYGIIRFQLGSIIAFTQIRSPKLVANSQ